MKGESGGIIPLKILKIQVVGNTISTILRQSQRVLISKWYVDLSYPPLPRLAHHNPLCVS